MASDHSSEVSSLRSEIRSVKSDVSDLKHQVSKVSGLSDRLRRLEETLPAALDNLAKKQDALQHAFDGYRTQYERDRLVANAYNELAIAERQWEQKFGRYEEARQMAASIIDAVGSGHISRSVLVDVTERLAVQTPRYWVAPATLAIAAWLDDNPQQHRDALDYALALDPGKTALFMALVLRDQDRDEILQEWLDDYLSRLTPANLPLHFQVVIDAVTGHALGDGAAPRLVKRMADWYIEAAGRSDVSDAAVGEWKRRLLSLGARDGREDFPMLAANEKAWPVLAPRHAVNRAIDQALQHFQGRFDEGADVSADVRANLATLLQDLARTPDPAEEEFLAAIREHRAITKTRGDLDAARARIAADEAGRTGTLNIVSMVSRTAFPTTDTGQLAAPTVNELLAIMLSGRLIATAADTLREELPRIGTVELLVGERQWSCYFSCDYEAAVTRPALRRQAADQAKKICDQIQKDTDRRQGLMRRLKKWGCPGALATAVGLGGATFIPTAPPELMVPAFFLAVPALLGMNRLPKVVRRATDKAEAEKRAVTTEINGLADQMADLWDLDLRCSRGLLPELRGFLQGLKEEHVIAATRPLQSVPLPRTREFPSWTPRPPRQRLPIEGAEDLLSLDD